VCTYLWTQDAKVFTQPPMAEVETEEVTVPYGDVPAIPYCNPLHVRMFERWLEADGAGDRITKNRQEGRMLRWGFEPPVSRADAESKLSTLTNQGA